LKGGVKMYIENDEQFEEILITKVKREKDGWAVTRADGWTFWISGDSPVVPKEGMLARFYGKGLGYAVRGLFLDAEKVFYRTEAEDKEKREIDSYGADAADWLGRWDAGQSVWSIEMGGLGPGYEQCIQITCAEILRDMLAKGYDSSKWNTQEGWEKDKEQIYAASLANPKIEALGLSGAQWGAALSLASVFYMKGPRVVMADEQVKDRHIQVQRTFPVVN